MPKTSFTLKIINHRFVLLGKVIVFLAFVCFTHSCKKEVRADKSEHKAVYSNDVIETIKKQSAHRVLVCAHRGFHKYAPENSIKSIQDAIKANIDIAEVDIRTTKDSILILMHDDVINRTTTGQGYVKDYTYTELLEFNLKLNDSITPLKIPKLEDALLASKGRIILNLDLKDVTPLHLFRLLKQAKMQHQVFSFIWDKDLINEIIKIDALYAVLPLSRNKAEMELNLKSYHSTLQHFDDTSYNSEGMDWARKHGVQVFVNSLWDEDEDFIKGETAKMDSLIDLRPNIIQTDYPKQLLLYLKSKGLHK